MAIYLEMDVLSLFHIVPGQGILVIYANLNVGLPDHGLHRAIYLVPFCIGDCGRL